VNPHSELLRVHELPSSQWKTKQANIDASSVRLSRAKNTHSRTLLPLRCSQPRA